MQYRRRLPRFLQILRVPEVWLDLSDRNSFGPSGMSTRTVRSSIAAIVYGPVHPPFSLHTRTSVWSGSVRMSWIYGPLWVFRARLRSTSARVFRSIFIAFRTASALTWISGDGDELVPIRGYAPKTRSIGTIPSGPAVSFKAFTAIWKTVSWSVRSPSFFYRMSYARRSGACALSTFPTAQWASTGI